MVAQVCSEQATITIASSSIDLTSANHNWLLSTTDTVVVKSNLIEKMKLNVVDTTDWLKIELSNISEVELSDELNGKVDDFGHKFWVNVKDKSEMFSQAFGTKKVKKVSYSDRYLQSPWSLVLIGEMLAKLQRAENAQVKINTVFKTNPHNKGYFNNDWESSYDMETIYQNWFEEGLKVNFQLNLHNNRFEIPHRRMMTIEFEDGEKFTIKSDQGVGYWSLKAPSDAHYLNRFDFNLQLPDQVVRILEVRDKCFVKNSAEWPTDFVVSKL